MEVEDKLKGKNMTPDIETKDSEAKELLEKVAKLHEAFKTGGEKGPDVEADELEQKFQRLLEEIPDEAIRNRVAKIIDVLKREKVSTEGMNEIVEDSVHLNMEHYFDSREYVRLARKELSKYRLSQMVDRLAERETINIGDLQKLVRVAFDLNGLKAMNDIGGHKRGDEGLNLFSTILREGRTTKWLESLGFVVIPSAEGGDEFGLVISGLDNDKVLSDQLVKEIVRQYREEVYATEAKHLVDLDDKDVRDRLHKTGFSKKQIKDLRAGQFKFKLSSSIGASRFDEALKETDLPTDSDYKSASRAIIGRMFDFADSRATSDKEQYKSGLERSKDPNERALFELTARLDKESIKLRVQNRFLREILEEQGLTSDTIDRKLAEKAEAARQEDEKEED